MGTKSLLVFDMDGVLVDVTNSYRETVRRVARTFFVRSPGSETLPDPLFPLEDLAEVKRRGGLNNDWDLAFKIISMLFTKVAAPTAVQDLIEDPWDAYAAAASTWDVTALACFLSSGPGSLQLLYETNPEDKGLIGDFYSGDVCDGNVIKQIFQEIYLGGVLFASTYGMPPRVHQGEGLIYRETPLVTAEVLSRLHSRHMTAVATGRPRSEARIALDAHGFGGFFDFMLTLDDCLAEEQARETASGARPTLSKPDPFMLDTAAANAASKPEKLYYIGDMPDDMIAACRSIHPFIPVGVTGDGSDAATAAEALTRAGAQFLIRGVEELENILKTSP